MKKLFITTVIASVLMLVNVSCHKEADYVLHVGEGFSLKLYENPSSNMLWEWENAAETDVVSMRRLSDSETGIPVNVSDTMTIGGGGLQTFLFMAEKKGYAVVKMVFAKDYPEQRRRINFSVNVID